MNAIPSLNSPAFLPKDLQVLQNNLQTHAQRFGLKQVASTKVTATTLFETENSNTEPLSKRRKVEPSTPITSIESTVSTIGNDLLVVQQNPTEHLPPSYAQPGTPNSSNESDNSPQKAQKSKLTEKERQDVIEGKKDYEVLLKRGGFNARQKIDFKLKLYKYENKIAKDDNLIIQENFNDFKAQSASELNRIKEQYQKMIDDLITKNHAIEEIYTKKITSLNELNEQKITSLSDVNEQKITSLHGLYEQKILHFRDQIKKLTNSENISKLYEQNINCRAI